MENTVSGGFTREDTKVVKAIAVILMFVHHLFPFPDRLGPGIEYISMFSVDGQTVEAYFGNFGQICVFLFAFLGGYGTFLSCFDKKERELTAVLGKKVFRLYRAFWQVFVVFVPICMLCGVSRVPVGLNALIWNFLGLNTSYNGEWWFFTPYVFLLLSYPLLQNISGKFRNVFSELIAICSFNVFVTYILPEITGGGVYLGSKTA